MRLNADITSVKDANVNFTFKVRREGHGIKNVNLMRSVSIKIARKILSLRPSSKEVQDAKVRTMARREGQFGNSDAKVTVVFAEVRVLQSSKNNLSLQICVS